MVLPPPGNFQRADVYLRKRWRQVQYLTDTFWRRWKKEFLVNLQERNKWPQVNHNSAVGDVVLIQDDNAPRIDQWVGYFKLNQIREDSYKLQSFRQQQTFSEDRSTSLWCYLLMRSRLDTERLCFLLKYPPGYLGPGMLLSFCSFGAWTLV